MPLERFPALVCALVLGAYWCAVIYLARRLRRKIGKGPNSMPRDPVSRAMRLIWIPAIVLQILHCWRIALGVSWPFPEGASPAFVALPFQGDSVPGWWLGGAFAASVVVLACFTLTLVCWRKMGKSWRIGIDPNEKLEFVSSGPYTVVRHPIYALRILLDACAIFAVPTPFMAVVSGIDMLMLAIEARREEGYMAATHGDAYTSYMKRVGRFFPKLIRAGA